MWVVFVAFLVGIVFMGFIEFWLIGNIHVYAFIACSFNCILSVSKPRRTAWLEIATAEPLIGRKLIPGVDAPGTGFSILRKSC
jgi:hypothetical protein